MIETGGFVQFSLTQNLNNFARAVRRSRFVVVPNRFGETGLLRARFNDATFISHSRRYVWFSNEKVANSTLRATLQRLESNDNLPPHYRPLRRWTGPLLQPSEVDHLEDLLAAPDVKRFCVVRHPYRRLISCFRNKLERGPAFAKGYRKKMRLLGLDPREEKVSFDTFIRAVARQDQKDMDSHWRIQYYNVFLDKVRCNEIIQYTDLPSRLPSLLTELYPELVHPSEAGNLIVSRNRHSQNSDDLVDAYFTPALKDVVKDVYRLDFETFGFTP